MHVYSAAGFTHAATAERDRAALYLTLAERASFTFLRMQRGLI